jgi:hypothetical protein
VIGVTERLGGIGVWEAAMRYGDPAAAGDYAAEVEELGYSALWVPDAGGDLSGALRSLLASTSAITVEPLGAGSDPQRGRLPRTCRQVRATEEELGSAFAAAAQAKRDGRCALIEVILNPADGAEVFRRFADLPTKQPANG